MPYYPAFLDYLKWLLALAAVVCLFKAMPEPAGRRRGLLFLAGFVLAGLGVVAAGTVGLLFNRNAPHIHATGVLSHVVIHTGKGSSTKFRLSAAPAVQLSFRTAVHQVRNGEAAAIVYQEGSGSVLEMTVLDGPYAYFQYAESDDTFDSVVAICGGFGVILLGLFKWTADPTAEPVPTPADTNEMPDGVDSASLLHLSGERPEEPHHRAYREAPAEADSASLLHLNDRE